MSEKKEKKSSNTKKEKEKEELKKKDESIRDKTPKGEKKDVQQEAPSTYQPKFVEAAWYDWWEKEGFFKPEEKSDKKSYVMVLPPPNVTGTLHLGHALTIAVEDCLVRMKGENVLYLPGVDHAGIATQVVVEKRLKKLTGKSRHDIGREEFLKETFKWKDEYGANICSQLRRVGASLDWSREVFTMDEKLSIAVNEAFVRLYEKKLIYRATRLVNWDCTLNTAISNIEVDHKEIEKNEKIKIGNRTKKIEYGFLFEFAYKVEDSDEEIIVATTRPETIPGDTGIAVHPDDVRYKKLVGKNCIHPFNGRKIPIVADSITVDMNFGTGAVKITPGHDFNDFECGKRNKLEVINIMNDDGTLNEEGKPFTGMDRLDAREEVMKKLEELKLARGKKEHKLSIGVCQRSGDVIEPIIKPQWYFDCNGLAEQSLKAVKDGDLKILPNFYVDNWNKWLGDIREWCISRQLWWGHRIPAYFVVIEGKERGDPVDEGNWVVGRNEQEALEVASAKFGVDKSKIKLEQDEDVLDTWFSSGLFPFSTMGWPNNTQDFQSFYPNSTLETGADILFFWVARMVFMGLALTDKLPFDTVFLHAMVRDKEGKKMSKSLGNIIDPIDVIESITLEELQEKLKHGNLQPSELERAAKLQKKQFPDGIPECGTDALRFTLLNFTTTNARDINLDVLRINGYRTFCNKMWQTTQFALLNLKNFKPSKEVPSEKNLTLSFIDKWILSRLNSTIKNVDKALSSFNFGLYTTLCYDYWYKDVCDVYIEAIKPIMLMDEDSKERQAAQTVLYTCIETVLRLLHPTMPFITEELWQRLPGHSDFPKRTTIMLCSYPTEVKEWDYEIVEQQMDFVQKICGRIRFVKASYSLTNHVKPEVYLLTDSDDYMNLFTDLSSTISTLSFCGKVQPKKDTTDKPEGCVIEYIDQSCSAYINLRGHLDVKSELAKLDKKKKELTKGLESLIKLMSGAKYDKVPENIKEQNEEKKKKYELDLKNIDNAIQEMEKFN